MEGLPTLEAVRSGPSDENSPLATSLSILFEHSHILTSKLEPQLTPILKSIPPLHSYIELIDLAILEIEKWDISAQSEFISGHPRIGESKNLSKLSAKEQGGQKTASTPPEVLARLEHLNLCYETKYPGLRFITFVNGRSRAEVAKAMEDLLEIDHSLSPDEPNSSSLSPTQVGDKEWRSELQRAVRDIGHIAKSRLEMLGF